MMIKAVVTDIEGTTSSLSFVREVLFPYAHSHLADFVAAHRHEPEVAGLLEAARGIAGNEFDDAQLLAAIRDWMDRDLKITPLKALQGLIWQDGYRQGHFSGHLYADAARRLKEFRDKGYALYVYSSGSVQAQQLLFSHTAYGDLMPLFSGFFDTHVGGKREADSYRHIAARIGVVPAEILFLSDIEEELDAAREAGFQTCWLVRDQPVDDLAAHTQVSDFDAIPL